MPTDEILFLVRVLLFSALLLSLPLLPLGGWLVWRIRQIPLPPDADFSTALRHTPLSVVIFLDLLDFALDIFAAPIAWVILGRLGLTPLRGVTIVEELIPGTQALPTMTVAWLLVRLFTDGEKPPRRGLDG